MDCSRTSRIPMRRVAMMAGLAALLAPIGSAEAATKKKKIKQPVVTSVTPMNASIGETISIKGRNFRRGKGKNSVVFRRDGARAVFVKSDVSTTKLIKVVLPAKLNEFLIVKDGTPVGTKFRIRVLASRFGKRFTAVSKSPVIGPQKPPAPPTPPKAAEDGDCDGDNVKNGVDTDDDNDLLLDSTEASLKLDACNRDSDADGVEDGYEHRSARDLNDDDYQTPNTYLPYPEKRPYPNALFADANTDYDGDGLTLLDEYKLWNGFGERNLDNLNYSDGEQYTRDIAAAGYDKQQQFLASAAAKGYSEAALLNMNGFDVDGDEDNPFTEPVDVEWGGDTVITDVERYYYDYDANNRLSDNERDEDADGLPNWVEAHGYMTPDWWAAIYKEETPFTVSYSGTAIDDGDTDGDGVVDGADDQDHDDFPNVRELSRRLAAGEVVDGAASWTPGAPAGPRWIRPFDEKDPLWFTPLRAWLNPFNPCLPNPDSRTCPIYHPATNSYPPFDPEDKVFLVKN